MWFFSKTCRVLQASLMGTPLSSYSGRLPKWGTMHSGDIYALRTQAHRTCANGGSAWPTPNVPNGGRVIPQNVKLMPGKAAYHDGRKVQVDLKAAVTRWPTPIAGDGQTGGQIGSDGIPRGLYGLTKLMGNGEIMIPQRQWATPAAQDGKNATLPPSQFTMDTLPGDVMRSGERGSLNPDWVEMLMGYPPGWTDISSPPLQACRSTRQNRRASRRQRQTVTRALKRSVTRSFRRSSIR